MDADTLARALWEREFAARRAELDNGLELPIRGGAWEKLPETAQAFWRRMAIHALELIAP